VRRLTLFQHDGDYLAWLRAFSEAQQRVPIDIFAYCLMPNHFHLVLRPLMDGDLADFMRLGAGTHSKRWHEFRGSRGTGAVYQGRYRAFPIATDRYFLNACRYVEANPLRAALVPRAEEWKWSSLAIRRKNCNTLTLAEWPILQPGGWVNLVNESCSESDLDALRRSVRRSAPFGPEEWARATATALGLERSFRAPGRPKKTTSGVVS
jgi:putative transposase